MKLINNPKQLFDTDRNFDIYFLSKIKNQQMEFIVKPTKKR